MKIDFRSDTFTKPDAGMLHAMMTTEVGDDVFSEDPTVNALEAYGASLFGMEASVFCPSGTMTNQIAIQCHTQPGDEVICEKMSHVYIYEGGGIAKNAGSQVAAIDGDHGKITADQITARINPDDIHRARTRLVSLENTCNRGGGSCYAWNELEAIQQVCRTHELSLHLDGARLFNALVATGQTALQHGQLFDSISICLSKGLGAPVGSLLLGSAEFIKKARRVRKVMGGGMRQAGFLAAAGLYSLKQNIDRLKIDHFHAQQLQALLATKEFVGKIMPVETNILIFEVKGTFNPLSFKDYLLQHKIYVMPISPTQVRMVTHLDITADMIARTMEILAVM